jgi:hypothetical protein
MHLMVRVSPAVVGCQVRALLADSGTLTLASPFRLLLSCSLTSLDLNVFNLIEVTTLNASP